MNCIKFKRQDVEFKSYGITCRAWLYVPELDKKPPVIVMAHGLGAIREMRLEAYGERFAQAGFACLLFDYRNMGASDGKKRQRINVKEQLEDWEAAIAFVKKSKQIDREKIALFGISFSGGHVIIEACRHPEIKAVISQCPYTSTFGSLRKMPLLTFFKVSGFMLLDILSNLSGYHPVKVKLAGKPNSAAFMAVKDYALFLEQAPPHAPFKNETPARTGMEFFKYHPGRYAKDVKVPIYYAVCARDTVTPANKTIEKVKSSPKGKVKIYMCGHFDISLGEYFEKGIKDYIYFLRKNLC